MAKPNKAKVERAHALLRQYAGTRGLDRYVAEQVGMSIKTIRKYRKQLGIEAGQTGRPTSDERGNFARPADDLTREDRLLRLGVKLEKDPKYRLLKQMLNREEYEIFMSEFLNIAQDMESLDSFEESHLYTAVLDFVTATRYAITYQKQRQAYDKFLKSGLRPDDPVVQRDSSMRAEPANSSLIDDFQRATDTFNKVRREFARIQEEKRKRVMKDKKSFSDYLEYYQSESKRREALQEISDFANRSNDELRRMIESGELLGYFE